MSDFGEIKNLNLLILTVGRTVSDAVKCLSSTTGYRRAYGLVYSVCRFTSCRLAYSIFLNVRVLLMLAGMAPVKGI